MRNFNYSGIVNDNALFITNTQLKNKHLWSLVAKQFSSSPDNNDNGWRGEYWGKLMRGACMIYQYTFDEELYTILSDTVKELFTYADEDGRICTYDKEHEFNGWDMWSRKYVLLGLIHFYEICKDDAMKTQILNVCKKHLDYIIAHVGNNAGKINITETSHIWGGINSSSILEPVVRLYNLTKEQSYLDFAKYIVENGCAKDFDIFEAAYENKLYPYEYPVLKAYELMSCFEGLLEYHLATGIDKYRIAVENFAEKLIESEITIIGAAGCEHELFNHSTLMQTGTKYTGLMLETCVTVTWMKLCARLLKLTGDSKYADEIEKSAYNALYGAVNTQRNTCSSEATFDEPYFRDVYNSDTEKNKNKGQVFDSYSPLMKNIRGKAVGGFRPMENNTEYCGCCIAIGAAAIGLVPTESVTSDANGIKFSLYIPGSVSIPYNDKAIDFNIETSYPVGNNVKITLKDDAKDMGISLRIPYFSQHTTIAVNGDTLPNVKCNEYYFIRRNWKKNDVVTITFDMNPRILKGMKNPDDTQSEKHISVMYGPLVLARDARLGEVGKELNISTCSLKLAPVDVDFPVQCAFDVIIDDEHFTMIDYASAGQTWQRDSEFEAWLPTV